MAFFTSPEVGRQLVDVFVDDVDLDPARRTIRCGERTVARPEKARLISTDKARELEEEVGWKAGFLQKLRAVM
jgi:hypothetical protein